MLEAGVKRKVKKKKRIVQVHPNITLESVAEQNGVSIGKPITLLFLICCVNTV